MTDNLNGQLLMDAELQQTSDSNMGGLYRLMDIKLVLRNSFVYLMPFLSE